VHAEPAVLRTPLEGYWARVTWSQDWVPPRGAAGGFEPVIAGRFDDVVHACDRSASASIGYAALAQPPPRPPMNPRQQATVEPRWAPGRGRRPKTAVLAAQADPGYWPRWAGQECLEWLRVDLRPDAPLYPSER
jgi:hypothetical protein